MFDFNHLHPMLVHFPIALLIIGFLSDALGLVIKKEFFAKVGFYLLILGTLGAIAAFLTGNLAGDGLTEAGPLKRALETHEEAAELTLWLMIAAAAVRIALVFMKRYSGLLKWAAFALLLIGVLSVARTGYYGGQLVYNHAAGVQFNLGLDLGSIADENPNMQNRETENDD